MLSFRKKILMVGVVCLIPSYVMGGCQKRGDSISCQGQSSQPLNLTKIETEIYNSSMEIFDEVLNNSDNINQAMQGIRKLLSLGQESIRISKSIENKINGLNVNINNIENQLQGASRDRDALEGRLSTLINRKFDQEQYLVKELTSLKERYRSELGQLRNTNDRLNSLIQNSSRIVSSSLSNKFGNYTTCLSHDVVLKNLILPTKIQGQSISYFSGSNSGSISNYSHFISALSQFSISRNSLSSCAEDFKKFEKEFVLYEVTLGLVVNGANTGSIRHLFTTYRGQEPSNSDIQSFRRYFNSLPKQHLKELGSQIDSYMLR